MGGNELYQPLRRKTRRAPPRLRTLPVGLGGALAVAVALMVAASFRGSDVSEGEPFATATVTRVAAPSITATAPPRSPVSPDFSPAETSSGPAILVANPPAAPQRGSAAEGGSPTTQIENGVAVIRASASLGPRSTPGPLILKVPGSEPLAGVALAPAPDPRLAEASAGGLLPRIGTGGDRARDVYAHPPVATDGKPRIAILVGGMGLDREATTAAGSRLPDAVTFAFAPYGDNLDEQVQAARRAGHEVVLQIPMEGFGQAGTGLSHMLLTSGGNADRLRWLLSRCTGYVGLGNYLGGRFLGEEDALKPVLKTAGDRGLLFVDDATTPRSLALPLAEDLKLPALRADLILDASSEPAAIAANFARLEALARERGSAFGVASGRPETIAALDRLVTGLKERGSVLVPVSQLARVPGAEAAGTAARR